MHIRELRPADRAPLEALIRACGAFREDEVVVAMELIDAGMNPASGYLFAVAADERDVAVGYGCWGLTPLTDAIYDFYWLVVDLTLQRSGIGSLLWEHVRVDARARGGRYLVVETSGKPDYAKQRAFFAHNGAELLVRYPDFYRVGDDKLVYLVRL